MNESLIVFGDPLKSLGTGRYGGYLVRYGSPSEPDLTGDFFDARTDFWQATSAPVLYNHGLNPTLKAARLGTARLTYRDPGVWAEVELQAADAYASKVRELLDAGKLSWSSGSIAHLVDREPAGAAKRITRWPIAEASLTPTPAEFRGTRVLPLKSLQVADSVPTSLDDLPRWLAAAKAGRVLSAANRSRLESLAGELERGAASLRDLLATADAVSPLEALNDVTKSAADRRATEAMRLSIQLLLMELP